MYQDTIDQFAELAAKKVKAIADNPLGFFIASMMAGAYVGPRHHRHLLDRPGARSRPSARWSWG